MRRKSGSGSIPEASIPFSTDSQSKDSLEILRAGMEWGGPRQRHPLDSFHRMPKIVWGIATDLECKRGASVNKSK